MNLNWKFACSLRFQVMNSQFTHQRKRMFRLEPHKKPTHCFAEASDGKYWCSNCGISRDLVNDINYNLYHCDNLLKRCKS